jgi:hypothetical protein
VGLEGEGIAMKGDVCGEKGWEMGQIAYLSVTQTIWEVPQQRPCGADGQKLRKTLWNSVHSWPAIPDPVDEKKGGRGPHGLDPPSCRTLVAAARPRCL